MCSTFVCLNQLPLASLKSEQHYQATHTVCQSLSQAVDIANSHTVLIEAKAICVPTLYVFDVPFIF